MPTVSRLNPATGQYVIAAYDVSLESYGNGVALDTLTDQSGHGLTLSGSGTARPTCRTNRLNGWKIAEFDGVNDRLVAASVNDWSLLSDGHGWTILLVVRLNTLTLANTYHALLATGNFTNTNIGMMLYIHASGGLAGLGAFMTHGVADAGLLTVAVEQCLNPYQWCILAVKYQPKAQTLEDFATPLHDMRMIVNGIGVGGATWDTTKAHSKAAPTYPLTLGTLGDGLYPAPIDLAALSLHRYDLPASLFRSYVLYYQDKFKLGWSTNLAEDCTFNGSVSAIPVPNGTWIAQYSKFPFEELTTKGDDCIVQVRSSDFGRTWSTEQLVDSSTVDLANSSLLVTQAGTVLATADSYTPDVVLPTYGIVHAYLRRSTDNGYTWGPPIDLHGPSGFTYISIVSGTITQLINGDILALVQGLNVGETLYSMKVIKSTDDGMTWGSPLTLASGPGTSTTWIEGAVLKVAGSSPGAETVLATFDDFTNFAIYSCRSTNSGATWSAPALVLANYTNRPDMWRSSSGHIFLMVRPHTGTERQGIRWSGDLGVTWSTQDYWADGFDGYSQYGAGFEVEPGYHYICFSADAAGPPGVSLPHMQLPRGMIHREADILAIP